MWAIAICYLCTKVILCKWSHGVVTIWKHCDKIKPCLGKSPRSSWNTMLHGRFISQLTHELHDQALYGLVALCLVVLCLFRSACTQRTRFIITHTRGPRIHGKNCGFAELLFQQKASHLEHNTSCLDQTGSSISQRDLKAANNAVMIQCRTNRPGSSPISLPTLSYSCCRLQHCFIMHGVRFALVAL